MRLSQALIAAGVLAAPSVACAQLAEIHNPGFETPNEFDSTIPHGWGLFNTAIRREIGDGGGPILVRSGNASLELPSGSDFSGATTDIFNPDTGDFYNVSYDANGGTAVFSGWYAIPADEPLKVANASLKLQFETYYPEDGNYGVVAVFENLSINGTTDGEWVYFEMVVTPEDIAKQYKGDPPINVCQLLPIRFGAPNSTGTIFWDDLNWVQEGASCYPDFTGDGVLDLFDFLSYVNAFNAGDPGADCDGDGGLTLFDFLCFVNEFNAGC